VAVSGAEGYYGLADHNGGQSSTVHGGSEAIPTNLITIEAIEIAGERERLTTKLAA
jgi:hypothetical protein